MNCDEIRNEFSALLDGELEAKIRAQAEQHLAGCPECRRALEQMKQVDVLYRGLAPQMAPEGFEKGVRARIAASHAVAPRTVRPIWRRWYAWVPAVAAVALVVFIGIPRASAPPDRLHIASVKTRQEASTPYGVVSEHAIPTAAKPMEPQTSSTTTTDSTSPKPSNAPIPETQEGVAQAHEIVKRDTSSPDTVHTVNTASPSVLPPHVSDIARDDTAVSNHRAISPAPGTIAGPGTLAKRPKASMAAAAPLPPPVPGVPAATEEKPQTNAMPDRETMEMKKETESAIPPTPTPTPAPHGATALPQASPESASSQPSPQAAGYSSQSAKPDSSERPVQRYAAAKEETPDSRKDGLPSSPARDAVTMKMSPIPVPKAPTPPRTKTVADRTFVLREGVWQQEGYTSGTRASILYRDSRTLATLLKKHPDLAPILEVGDRVIFQCDHRWYHVEPKAKHE